MKTSEFKKRVEELGYTTTGDVGVDIWSAGNSGEILAFVSGLHRFSVNIYRSATPELFDLVVEYARTPIEERKDEKKYYLVLPFDDRGDVINQDTGNGEIFMSDKDEFIGLKTGLKTDLKTRFTESEIAKLEKRYNLDSFEREEVIKDERD